MRPHKPSCSQGCPTTTSNKLNVNRYVQRQLIWEWMDLVMMQQLTVENQEAAGRCGVPGHVHKDYR
jgi:hypothetical protein